MRRTVAGCLSGLAATLPMTATMKAVNLLLPRREQGPLPPRRIVDRSLQKLNVDHKVPERADEVLTWTSHFGYGAAWGAAYPLIADRVPLPPMLKGAAFGMLVWASGYAGWLPALGILPPPQKRPAGRNALLISSHLVWGMTLGVLMQDRSEASRRSARDEPPQDGEAGSRAS